jgi:hypothetical protein
MHPCRLRRFRRWPRSQGEFTAALGGDQAFELGLAALLDGIELHARR